MNKKVFGKKLGRSRPAREALFSGLVRNMILSGQIVTTKAKAKAIQGDLDHMITLAKKGDLSSRRKVLAYLDNAREASELIFKQVAGFFKNRASGFTRMIPLPARRGDRAPMVRIEWTEKIAVREKVTADRKKTKTEKTKQPVR